LSSGFNDADSYSLIEWNKRYELIILEKILKGK